LLFCCCSCCCCCVVVDIDQLVSCVLSCDFSIPPTHQSSEYDIVHLGYDFSIPTNSTGPAS
jgi:hypothetical protein